MVQATVSKQELAARVVGLANGDHFNAQADETGSITIPPVKDRYECIARVRGMYKDGKLSIEQFFANRQEETALEL